MIDSGVLTVSLPFRFLVSQTEDSVDRFIREKFIDGGETTEVIHLPREPFHIVEATFFIDG